MLRKALKIGGVVLLLFSMGTAGYLKVQNIRLLRTQQALEGKVDELSKKGSAFQANYVEKRTLSDSLLRAKSTLEGQKLALEAELEKLRKDYELAAGGNQAMAQKCSERIHALEASVKSIADEHGVYKAQCAERERKAALVLKEREEEHRKLKEACELERRDLEAELKKSAQRLDRCAGHNAALAEIATELVDRYQQKGVMGAILQKEPLTQMKKVELEHLVQEYRETIDRQRLRKGDGP
jgi:hypothetical protein